MDREAEAFRQAATAKATYDKVKRWREIAERWSGDSKHGVTVGWNTGRQVDGYYEITTEIEDMIDARLKKLVLQSVQRIEDRCREIIEGLNQ